MKHTAGILLLFAALWFAGCETRDPRFNEETIYLGGARSKPKVAVSAKTMGASTKEISYWKGDGVTGSPHVRISLGEQRAYFYKGQDLVGLSVISTGREGFNTPTGRFHIIQKDKNHTSSRFGDYIDSSGYPIKKEIDRDIDPMPKGARYDGARMPYFMRITGGVGMHEGFLPGYPASHGCIRMPGSMAQSFFRNIEVGSPVEIEP